MFTNKSLADEFTWFGGMVGYVDEPLEDIVNRFREDVRDHVHRLDSIMERLDLLPEPGSASTPARTAAFGKSRKIFVVHGHNEGVRESVCRLLEKLKLEPIVLHEQASKGQTIIEKLEAHSEVEFAVVLLTGDDVGSKKSEPDKLRARARQNVILELGYFIGNIGRNRVCALYEDGVERPSDYDGVVYVSLAGGWHFELAKEIRAAGIDIDLNLL